ncbi:ArsR/SmtB family transcription factor [Streptomyces yaizuensis]|uniref:Metalloregulator ArsR/SmtB family transcription factor n=1 Tax=Streptomyces yaizuensis TaxID=2989713 RepID=A0ABQ5NWV2_9ACTN|nr:metalloregulator ArsR/SmtB family transcription factor [Streptomyces sp. YSPA8]GLF94831.1 metalloregulator ArsR/SmtB family transcription factor [Streptomyces sp. YSPA8]
MITGDAEVSQVLSALADPTRRRILDALVRQGGSTATVLAEELPVTRQAIVKHLGVLARAGLVVARREGREARYSVVPGPLDATARWMERTASIWGSRLAAIRKISEATDRQATDHGRNPS